MGIELIDKATDSFERKQRKCLDALEESDLFSAVPRLSVGVLANPFDGHRFEDEQLYRLALVDGRLMVIRGITVVGEVQSPPPSIIDQMRVRCPSVSGRVIKRFALTGKAELLLEDV